MTDGIPLATTVGWMVGFARLVASEGIEDGRALGEALAVIDGIELGETDGKELGDKDGLSEGDLVGSPSGDWEATLLCVFDGLTDGVPLFTTVGLMVGLARLVPSEGIDDGRPLGEATSVIDGIEVGGIDGKELGTYIIPKDGTELGALDTKEGNELNEMDGVSEEPPVGGLLGEWDVILLGRSVGPFGVMIGEPVGDATGAIFIGAPIIGANEIGESVSGGVTGADVIGAPVSGANDIGDSLIGLADVVGGAVTGNEDVVGALTGGGPVLFVTWQKKPKLVTGGRDGTTVEVVAWVGDTVELVTGSGDTVGLIVGGGDKVGLIIGGGDNVGLIVGGGDTVELMLCNMRVAVEVSIRSTHTSPASTLQLLSEGEEH